MITNKGLLQIICSKPLFGALVYMRCAGRVFAALLCSHRQTKLTDSGGAFVRPWAAARPAPWSAHRLFKKPFKLFYGKGVVLIAEMAVYLHRLSFINHFLNLFLSHTD